MVEASLCVRGKTGSETGGTLPQRMAVAREATPVESAEDVKQADLDSEDLLQIYRNMLVTRGIEERGHILYRQGKIPGSFYTGRGNEGASVGVATAMRPDDVGTPIQRDMGVHVTRGTEAWRIFAQYMGRRDGLAMGKDGNVHMADIRLGLIAMVSHLPAQMPVAVGCALALQIRREPRVAVTWSGDRAAAYGCGGVVVDGCDVRTVYREAHAAIEKARAGGGPTLLELVTLRMEGHAVHDDAFYVPREMLEQWKEKDPIERHRRWLKESGVLGEAVDDEITVEVKKLLNEAMKRAEESPLPDAADLDTGVYADPEELDTPHHR